MHLCGDSSRSKEENYPLTVPTPSFHNMKRKYEGGYKNQLPDLSLGELGDEFAMNWPRPSFAHSNSDLIFQQMSMDYIVEKDDDDNARPVIRIMGITAEHNSVLLHVRGHRPYIYMPVHPDCMQTDELCEDLRVALNNALITRILRKDDAIFSTNFVLYVSIVERRNVMGYNGDHTTPFFKIIFAIHDHIRPTMTLLESGAFTAPGIPQIAYTVFEANVPYVLRFMIDHDIAGAQWIRVPNGRYFDVDKKKGHCQIEVCCKNTDIESLDVEAEEWSQIAPLRILSFGTD